MGCRAWLEAPEIRDRELRTRQSLARAWLIICIVPTILLALPAVVVGEIATAVQVIGLFVTMWVPIAAVLCLWIAARRDELARDTLCVWQRLGAGRGSETSRGLVRHGLS